MAKDVSCSEARSRRPLFAAYVLVLLLDLHLPRASSQWFDRARASMTMLFAGRMLAENEDDISALVRATVVTPQLEKLTSPSGLPGHSILDKWDSM